MLNQQLSTNYQCFSEQLKTLKNINDRELNELKSNLMEVKQFNNEFSNYKVITSFNDNAIKNLHDKVVTLQWLLGLSWVVIGSVLYFKK